MVMHRLIRGDTITAKRRNFSGNPPVFSDSHPTKSDWRWLPERIETPSMRAIIDSPGDEITSVDDGYVVVSRQVNTMSLEVASAAARRLIHQASASPLQEIMDRYPPHERETWSIQLAQARAFTADPNAETGMLDTLAEKRGQTRARTAARIIEKAAQFEAMAADVIGTQQAREDAIEAAEDVDGVLAVLQAEQLL